jgi:hypothetical protein
MNFQEPNPTAEQMECAAMLHSYDALRQWTDFSLFENDQTFINREDSCEPNFSVETFPVSCEMLPPLIMMKACILTAVAV